MDHALVVGFATASLVIVVVPGPSVLFAVSRAVAAGRRTALLTVLGNAGGLLVQVVVVALGLGLVVAESALARQALELAGAAYLVGLGVVTIRRRHATAHLTGRLAPPAVAGPLRDGFMVGVTNPKSIVFLAAFLPQWVAGSGPVPAQMLLLGLLFCGMALSSDALWALGAARARSSLASEPRRLAQASAAGGLLMVGLGLALVLG